MITYAKDCKCIECGEQAVAFWPTIDPDIPSNPYCRACLDKVKLRMMIGIFELQERGDTQENEDKQTQPTEDNSPDA